MIYVVIFCVVMFAFGITAGVLIGLRKQRQELRQKVSKSDVQEEFLKMMKGQKGDEE